MVHLHRFAVFTALATFILLIAGGLVTSTDSGLAVPDWPLSYGTLFPPMVGGIVYEHTHRMIAGFVGMLIAILAMWLWRAEKRRWVKRLGFIALGAVITQAVLGGLTVLLVLPAPVSIAHACLGQLVFCTVVVLALATSNVWKRRAREVRDAVLYKLCLAATWLIAAQLVLGAILRHTGRVLLVHIAVAIAAWIMAVRIGSRLVREPRHDPWICRLAVSMVAMITLQILVGLTVLRTQQQAAIATLHVALGAAVLATALILTLVVRIGDGTR